VDESDRENLGVLMVMLLASVFVSVCATVVLEIRAILCWAHEIKYTTATIEQDPFFDPSLKDHIISIDELTMGKVLGKGAEGLVRKAIYAGTEVAVKVVNVTPFSGIPVQELLRNAQMEAQTLQPLHHPVGAA
jgi:hypothetical protein